MANVSNAINATLYDSLPFDFVHDMAAVAGIVSVPYVMEVNPEIPARTVAEFISYAKANKGKINMASAGTGKLNDIDPLAWLADGTGLHKFPRVFPETLGVFQHHRSAPTGPFLVSTHHVRDRPCCRQLCGKFGREIALGLHPVQPMAACLGEEVPLRAGNLI
jgi:hypothetical protein